MSRQIADGGCVEWGMLGRRDAMEREELELFARCASGFEKVLAQELKDLGMRRVRPLKGGVAFFAQLSSAYKACLWSRVATRVQLVITRVPAQTAEELYDAVVGFAWEQHISRGATIAVDAHGQNEALRNTKFTALKVKDALCDRLRNVWGMRPNVDAHNPGFALDVALHAQKATLYLNLSGPSLHRRGYREDGVQTEAPLKETLAAGLLLAADWPRIAWQGGTLIDPMCGSGTIAIEGALMATNRAPGLLRDRWGFEGWARHDADVWGSVLAEAYQAIDDDVDAQILAGDIGKDAVDIARQNVRRAGVEAVTRLFVDDAARLSRHLRGPKFKTSGVDSPNSVGLLATNPPYGQRLLSQQDLPRINAMLASVTSTLPNGWSLALITPDTSVDTALGQAPHTVIDCYNGPIQACVRIYRLDDALRQTCDVVSLGGVQRSVPVAEKNSAQFAARLRKVAKERMRWAKRQGITCCRVYDADLPDYALSVDLYLGVDNDEGRRMAVVEERRRPSSVDAHRADRRLADACALAAAVLDVPREALIRRPWNADVVGDKQTLTVQEYGLRFEPCLGDAYESGLPLIMRGVRELVRELARGARFANLFDASSAATISAAAGGAATTTTVNAFSHDANRVRAELDANGFKGKAHRLVRDEPLAWIKRTVRQGQAYDLVLCAPSAKVLANNGMELVKAAAELVNKHGTMILVCDDAKLNPKGLNGFACDDVSAKTLPQDFARSVKNYRCYLLKRA